MNLYICNMEINKLVLDQLKVREKTDELSVALVKRVVKDFNKREKLGITDGDLDVVSVKRDRYGKPHLVFDNIVEAEERRIHYSVSHSGSWWACLIALHNVGLDIEDMKLRRSRDSTNNKPPKGPSKGQRYQAIANRFFTIEEKNYVENRSEEDFFDIWVRKEAYIKYKGKGLSEGLGSFSVVKEGELLNFIEAGNSQEELKKPEDRGAYIHSLELNKDMKIAYCLKEDAKIQLVLDFFSWSK